METIKSECIESLNSEFHLKCSIHSLLEIMKYPQFAFKNELGEYGKINLFGLKIDADNNYPKDTIIIDNGTIQYELMTEDLCEYLRESAYD